MCEEYFDKIQKIQLDLESFINQNEDVVDFVYDFNDDEVSAQPKIKKMKKYLNKFIKTFNEKKTLLRICKRYSESGPRGLDQVKDEMSLVIRNKKIVDKILLYGKKINLF